MTEIEDTEVFKIVVEGVFVYRQEVYQHVSKL
jgi:hypothetical protein